MKQFDVYISETVTLKVRVHAENEAEAREIAAEQRDAKDDFLSCDECTIKRVVEVTR